MGDGLRTALVLVAMVLPGAALAQPRPSPPVASAGQPTLQPEPGDFWADVKAWNEQARRRAARGGRVEPLAPAAVAPNAPRRPPRPEAVARPKPG